MYCKKCGKFIETESDYCNDCSPKEVPIETVAVEGSVAEPVCIPAEPVKPERQGRVMDGFGPALTSVILGGEVAAPLATAAYMLLLMGSMMRAFGDASGIALKAVCIIYVIIAIGFGIPSLVMGIKSIKLFRSAADNNRVKPIPALILGICGTVHGGSALAIAASVLMGMLDTVTVI